MEPIKTRALAPEGPRVHSATSDRELFDQMTELYPHWVANQSWLMFGFPQP
jgi:hypothetical protein